MYLNFYPATCNFWKLGYGSELSLNGQIIDSLRLKEKPLRSSSPIIYLAPQCSPLSHIPKCPIHVPCEHFKGW